jgi:5-methylcytosine-specific restriction enzyme A
MPMKLPRYRPQRPRLSDGRPSASARGYDEYWRALRLRILRERPVCEACKRKPATCVDHDTSLRNHGTHDEANLFAYCRTCHNRKGIERDGLLGRKPKGGD